MRKTGKYTACCQRKDFEKVLAKPLDWPLPPNVDKSYDAVDGKRLHRYVEELAAISDKYRDAGNQWWGRIPGMSSGTETQNWAKEKFKAIGVPTETVTIPDPQTLPKSWDVSVAVNGKTLKLDSSQPIIDFTRYMPSAQGDEEMDTVWVGLGQASDFVGKDVRGKAVYIYSIPTPSDLIQSAMWMGSVARAQRAGAKAVIIDVAIPGNMHYVSHMDGTLRDFKIPILYHRRPGWVRRPGTQCSGQWRRPQDACALGRPAVPGPQRGHRYRKARGNDG